VAASVAEVRSLRAAANRRPSGPLFQARIAASRAATLALKATSWSAVKSSSARIRANSLSDVTDAEPAEAPWTG